MPPAERQQVLDRVGALYDAHAGPSGVELPYLTECFRAASKIGSDRKV